MRLNSLALALSLPVATILTGCGMGHLDTPVSAASTTSGTAKSIQGKAYGGQQPVTGATIALYTYGSSGYGSAGTLLATAATDAGGYFNIDPASINCPTPDTPVYLLSLGGNPGNGTNKAILLGASAGSCANAAQAFITINEISTAMLAYSFPRFFSNTTGDGTTSDHFGAPADATQVITNENNGNGTVFTLLDVENGYPRKNTATMKFEGTKLITMGNILGACVNSSGPGSPTCSSLFQLATSPTGAAPTNTLEAAVNIALQPTQNTSAIFGLQPQSGAAAFSGGLTASPADWTLSASFTSPNFGLALNTRTPSTIDIDTAGRVWFPSNAAGQAGIGSYDPGSGSFSGVYNAGLSHPQQVAIDIDNYVWANDYASPNIAAFPASNPSAATALTLPGSTSQSVTIAYDNTVHYGIVAPSGLPALAQVTGKNNYTETNGTEVPSGQGFVAASIAGDVVGGIAAAGQQLRTPTTYDLYFGPTSINFITYQTFQDAGQVVFTGNDFIGTRGGYNPNADGICIWSARNCFSLANDSIRHPTGLSIDGAGALWMADKFAAAVDTIPLTNGSYLNGNGNANNTVITHDPNNGGTLLSPAGIAVDRAGNVWVSNSGCTDDGCSPGAFTLTEILGAGAPTITPVSRQVVMDDLVGTRPQKKATTSRP